MNNKNKFLLASTALVVATGAFLWFTRPTPAPQSPQRAPQLAAGTPLPTTSTASIQVLTEAPTPQGLTIADSATATSTPSITLTEVTPPTAQPTLTEDLPTVAGLKLGTTIALLTQAYSNGGTLTRQLANVAVDQVTAAQVGGELRSAINNLRDATPQEGPTTPLMLLAEAIRIEAQKAPAGLPQTISTTTPTTSNWLLAQLQSLVTFTKNPHDSIDGWTSQLRLAQVQLSRGNGTDALLTLTSTPLQEDARLNPLRQLTRQYLDQQALLTNVINAYTRTFLTP